MPFYNNLVFRFISTNKPASQQALLQIFVSKTINEVYISEIKYRNSDILLKKKQQLHFSRLFCCKHTCYCVNMVYVTSASRYHPRYQSRSSMYIRSLIPRNFVELAEAEPLLMLQVDYLSSRPLTKTHEP